MCVCVRVFLLFEGTVFGVGLKESQKENQDFRVPRFEQTPHVQISSLQVLDRRHQNPTVDIQGGTLNLTWVWVRNWTAGFSPCPFTRMPFWGYPMLDPDISLEAKVNGCFRVQRDAWNT